jgi:Chitobiase/beta-hexosaminidase C-terminal domain/Legume lectin domain
MKRYLLLALIAFGSLLPASAQISCPSGFASSGSCGVSAFGGGGQNFALVGSNNGSTPALNGSRVDLIPNGATHAALSLNYQKLVNVNSFTASFTFVPNGQNIAFVLQNSNNNPSFNGASFSSGAGCEAGFFQAFGQPPPNNIFALELDSWSYLGSAQSFSYSSAQIYQSGQSPCNPNDSGPNYTLIDKISTSPVALNSPASSQGTSTGDVYSATVTYNGTDLTLNMYNVTTGGSCPGASCFTHTWTVDIPSWVGGNTAYVGFTAATGETSTYPLYVDSFSYADGSTPQTPTPTQATTPTFSPAAGTYSGAQSVTISDASSGATVYYTTNGTTPTTSSTKYTGPITVSSTETLHAIAVATGDANSAVASAAYTVDSSSPDPPDPANGPVINYPSGFASSPSELWLGPSSVYSGSSIALTESSRFNSANNAWYKTPVNVQAFTTTFTWTASCPGNSAECGDGLGFMIISNSNPSSAGYNYSGYSGQDLSWSRCNGSSCPSIKSVLVKFDLYNNSTGKDGANLTGFYSGGVDPQLPQPEYDMAPSGINMQSGHLMKATLTYNGTVLIETVTDTVTGATYSNSYSANIPALVGGNTALVGFGGSTGGATVTQNIQSWTYAVESPGN